MGLLCSTSYCLFFVLAVWQNTTALIIALLVSFITNIFYSAGFYHNSKQANILEYYQKNYVPYLRDYIKQLTIQSVALPTGHYVEQSPQKTLQHRLEEAIEQENYEEAANLTKLIEEDDQFKQEGKNTDKQG